MRSNINLKCFVKVRDITEIAQEGLERELESGGLKKKGGGRRGRRGRRKWKGKKEERGRR